MCLATIHDYHHYQTSLIERQPMDIDQLLEEMYSTEQPELLANYHIDIESEEEDGSWHGKVWWEREDTTLPILAVSNSNTGDANKYVNITGADNRNAFFEACRLAFPSSSEPVDTACIYLELREAKRQDYLLAELMKEDESL